MRCNTAHKQITKHYKLTQRHCNALQAKHKQIQIKHNAMWEESLSLVCQKLTICGFVRSSFSRFINLFFSDRIFYSFKFFNFLKFFNLFCSFLFVCKAKIHKFCSKIHKFSVIANEPQGEVWQSIVKSGFCGFYFVLRTRNTFFSMRKTASLVSPRKKSLTLIFARNDGVAKIHKLYKFFPNFYSTRFQNFEKFNKRSSL